MLSAVIFQPVSSLATVIVDNYVGSDSHSWGDRIGNDTFEIHNMDVSLTGTMLSVTINTNFAGNTGVFASYTYNNMGIGYGDLFLSNSWDPFGTAPYMLDDAATGTKWTYGFALDDRWNNGGSGTLYQLNGLTNDANADLSEDFIKNTATYRNGQEVAVDVTDNAGNLTEISSSGTWSITNGSSINFLIDLAGTDLLSSGSNEIGLHWGMTCGNDTIEGAYALPEPGMLALLSTGLAGLFVARRRSNKHK